MALLASSKPTHKALSKAGKDTFWNREKLRNLLILKYFL